MSALEESPARSAALVLTSRGGSILGQLPALPIATPWWQDIAPVVCAFRDRYGIEVTILRLLEAERAAPPGGKVTYLAEVDGHVDAAPWPGEIGEHPLRLPWAKPGGPAADVAWAVSHLEMLGMHSAGPAQQVRTWNLSSLWRLPVAEGWVWLKAVPPFFAHEAAILEHLVGQAIPRLLAHQGGRMLLAEAPGEDLYQADPDQLRRMIDVLVEMQSAHIGRVGELLAMGLPDWRGAALADAVAEVAERCSGVMSAEAARLNAFVAGLPARLNSIAEAGPGDSLMHGDFHPGNFRGEGRALTLLDWGDSGVGHPLLDQSAFLTAVPAARRGGLSAHWRRRWLRAAPGMDFDRAKRLIVPVAAARRAAVYQSFLDAIEPCEHPYHAADPAFWLGRALDLADTT